MLPWEQKPISFAVTIHGSEEVYVELSFLIFPFFLLLPKTMFVPILFFR